MARASVPRFGDWGGDGGNAEYPYTVCFDNARKGRSSSGKIMNPNDPQQNPNLFPPYTPQRDEPPRNLAPQVRTQTTQQDRKTRAEDRSADSRTTNGTRPRPQSIGGELPARTPNWSGSEEGGDSRRAVPSNQTGSRQSRPQSYGGPPGYNGVADKSLSRVAASPINQVRGNRGGVLPKFGDWEGKNGGGGEGYTQVFNKVREEKKVINGGMTPLPVQPEQSSNHNNNPKGGRSESMGVCCFPWSKK